jgi:hypothetical protein
MNETFCLGIISTKRLIDLTENNKWTSPKKIVAGWIYTGLASAVLGRPRSSAMAHRAGTQFG